jgi:hypothetical protein
MEIREITGMFVSVFTDDIMPYSYIRILTDSTVETVKLPSRFNDSKFRHYFSPYNILVLELIKTRKNWIVKDISVQESIVTNPSFDHILKHSQMLKLVSENVTEGQDIAILDWFIAQIKEAGVEINLENFKKDLHQKINFRFA